MAVGIFLNALVIALNGAMPVSTTAAEEVAPTQAVGSIKHEPLTDDTVLPLLADRIAVSAFGQVWSVGDLLLLAGVAVDGFRSSPRRRSVPRSGSRSPREAAA